MTIDTAKYARTQCMCWIFGVGFVISIVMTNVAITQRDKARELKVQMGSAEFVCKKVQP
ncbi:hypothetical protein [Pseudomonas chlororaphis]|uniref:hypothetical protein n=1 Tax=Pseudomonas chlororaphis TaxID=587753 RepID=UPI003C1B4469